MSVGAPPSPRGTSLIPYVPRHVLEEILHGDVADPWQPRRFQAVALFADTSGYTGMSEAFSSLAFRSVFGGLGIGIQIQELELR